MSPSVTSQEVLVVMNAAALGQYDVMATSLKRTRMSLWDRYLAPGDLRARRQQLATPPTSPTEPSQQREDDLPTRRKRLPPSTRSARQNNILYTGLALTLTSLLLTRRVLARKRLHDTLPPMSAPPVSNTGAATITPPEAQASYLGPKIHGPKDAAQAFGLATMNVFSLALVAVGGTMGVFDVGDLEDLRERVGRRKGKHGEKDGGIEEVIGGIFQEGDKQGEDEGKKR